MAEAVKVGPPGRQSKIVIVYYNGEWGTPEQDGNWSGWNRKTQRWERPVCKPPESVPSLHHPVHGFYSSHNETVVSEQLREMAWAGINVVAMLFGGSLNKTHSRASFGLFLQLAPRFNMTVMPVFSAYNDHGLNASVAYEDLADFNASFAQDEGVFRLAERPVVLFYDTHDFGPSTDMRELYPGWVLFGAGPNSGDMAGIFEAEYDGFCTWGVSHHDGWANNHDNWGAVRQWASDREWLFIPAVSPGYNDTTIDRWRRVEMVSRSCGGYYDQRWQAAIEASADMVLINSWNNWVQGSGIEPSDDADERLPLNDAIWCGTDPEFYLKRTKQWIDDWRSGE